MKPPSLIDILEARYKAATTGVLEPNIIITTPRAYNYIKARYRPQFWDDDIDPFDEYAASVLRLNDLEESIQGS